MSSAEPMKNSENETRSTSPEGTRSSETGTINLESLGTRLREERQRLDVSLREIARRIDVSPSLISQVERGLAMPSVSTLWLLATELGLRLDALFGSSEPIAAAAGNQTGQNAASAKGLVQRAGNRKRIRLAGGVIWERLTPQRDDEVEFLHVVYQPGAESCPPDSLFRHGGREYAYVLSGRLGLQIGFESYELAAGDSTSFAAQMPHRLWAIGSEPAVAIWVVINRTDDSRLTGGR